MYKLVFKRALDLILALVVFIILLPVFVIVSICLFFANDGKPFFFQIRPGKLERPFKILKFKTMTDERDAYGELLSDSARLTRIGSFVRKTSLDEIPQLLNIIAGDMSFVGPRPLLERYLPYYSNREKVRHTVQPGITGLAQVSGRNNLCWDERLELDCRYVETQSFMVDLKIFIKTIKNVISSKDVVIIPGTKFPPLDVERKNKVI